MIQYLLFDTSKLLNISEITKRIGNFFKLPIQLFIAFLIPNSRSYLDNDVWKAAGFSSTDPYKAAEYVLKEAYDIDDAIITRCENVDAGKSPDLDSVFYYLDGQYKDMVELTPMKAYGGNSPAFIRLYALKIDRNCYPVIHMGIKLAKRISESPELKR